MTKPITGHAQAWHVTNDGLDVHLHLKVSGRGWLRRLVERDLVITFDQRDASDCGYQLDQEADQIDATCSAIDDRDEAEMRWAS
jgi:hypothetical protein